MLFLAVFSSLVYSTVGADLQGNVRFILKRMANNNPYNMS